MGDRSIFDSTQVENLRRAYEASAAPGSAQDAVLSEEWQYWFFQYVWQDLESDRVAGDLVNLYRVADEWDLAALARAYVDDRTDLTWPDDLVTRIHLGLDGRGETSENELREELLAAAVDKLNDDYYATFLSSVQQAVAQAQAADQQGGAWQPATPTRWRSATPTQVGQDQDQGGQEDEEQGRPLAEDLPAYVRVDIYAGNDLIRAPRQYTIDDFLGYMNAYTGPDVGGYIDSVSSQVRARRDATPSATVTSLGGSSVAIGAAYGEAGGTKFIQVRFGAVLQADDFQPINDVRLHQLTRDGQWCWYTQCRDVVMLDPGQSGDILFATLRFAAMLDAGVSGQGTMGSITRSNRRMRTDALRVSPITASYKDAFKRAIREVSDKTIEWI